MDRTSECSTPWVSSSFFLLLLPHPLEAGLVEPSRPPSVLCPEVWPDTDDEAVAPKRRPGTSSSSESGDDDKWLGMAGRAALEFGWGMG